MPALTGVATAVRASPQPARGWAARVWMLVVVALGGCAVLPHHVPKYSSEALKDPQNTTLGRLVEQAAAGRPLSGVRLLASGDEAFESLIALADRAERTLDLQYYIVHQDDSTRLLMQHLRRAADRGVRVRLLVDDLNTAGEDQRFLRLARHGNIEVRLFNPFPGGRHAYWTRFLFVAYDIPRINHRMHNKLFVADDSIAIIGGRNLGDQYFVRDKYSNFIDLDVVAAGAVVPKLSASFDAFWNSKYAYPIAAIAGRSSDESRASDLPERAPAPGANWLAQDIDAQRLDLDWVPATVLADQPAKISTDAEPGEEATIADSISELMRSARHDLLIISAYFVPGEEGIALMRELRERGVKIRILTNSLASTDSPLVHNGYARYRKDLLKLGVELSEVRPRLGQKRPRFHPFRGSNASLHAKALVIDDSTVFIGSMNMDARSRHINSEVGLVIRDPEIARQVTSLFNDVNAEGAFHLSLAEPDDRIVWSSADGASGGPWTIDPQTTRWQRFLLHLVKPFAPEELL